MDEHRRVLEGCMDGRMSGCWKDGWWKDEGNKREEKWPKKGRMDRWKEERKDGRTDGGWMTWWKDKWMDGWNDG